MKKLTTTILGLALCAAMSTTAFAASPVTDNEGTDSKAIKGKYIPGTETQVVYSVDVAWGSMEFIYSDSSQGIWNPDTHIYENSASSKWNCSHGANQITITNHSNAPVHAALSASLNSGLQGNFDRSNHELPTAEGTTLETAPKVTAKFEMTGGAIANTDLETIGTLTVTISH